MSKINNLALLAIMSLLAVGVIIADNYWKGDPNTCSASIKIVISILLVDAFSIWYFRNTTISKMAKFVTIPLLILGLVSNAIAVLANSGKMPVDPALGAVGLPTYYVEGGNLLWLGDCLWMGNSIGDLIFFAGLSCLIIDLCVFAIRDSRKVKS